MSKIGSGKVIADTSSDFDVIIIGGGPAGISAFFWCAEFGLEAMLLEKNAELGGQLLRTYNPINNYLGVGRTSGPELCDLFLEKLKGVGGKLRLGAEIATADLARKVIVLADGMQYSSRAVVLAGGVRRRKLGLAGEEVFKGRGVLESGVKAKEEVGGKTVLIVGGGDAAIENALILNGTATQVIVVHRRSDFTARKEFMEQVAKSKKIILITNSQVTAIDGKEAVEFVEIENTKTGVRSRVPADTVLVRIGVLPNTEFFRGQVELDQAGYVKTDTSNETSIKGVYAVGDVTNHLAPTISAAVGHGAIASKAIFKQCVANAAQTD